MVDEGADKDDNFTPLDSDDSLNSRTAGIGRRGGDDSTDSNNSGNGLGSHGDAQSAEGNQGLSEIQDGKHETRARNSSTKDSIVEEEPSGFLCGVNGSSPIYTDGKFWNYVDDSLDRLCKRARKEAADHGREAEVELYSRMLNEILTLDLQEFPSQQHFDRNLNNMPPEWQQTIEQNLVWVPTQSE
ncbi:hypothetical protein HD554DRAFT_2035805 [Boletus coccyginus]|nr:hypothetical protein HD554DRAFT_2035805 [Boletus coccyginus]